TLHHPRELLLARHLVIGEIQLDKRKVLRIKTQHLRRVSPRGIKRPDPIGIRIARGADPHVHMPPRARARYEVAYLMPRSRARSKRVTGMARWTGMNGASIFRSLRVELNPRNQNKRLRRPMPWRREQAFGSLRVSFLDWGGLPAYTYGPCGC